MPVQFNHARQLIRARVPMQRWAEAVNTAFEAGVCIFAAAGNRIGPSPPATLVYPARFQRVVGVCGFTAERTPYFIEGFHRKMQGCFGPPSAMQTVLSTYTPNIPWADMDCGSFVNPDGGGTSAATPQCAAAAALWLQYHRPSPGDNWQRVEAVRNALFTSDDRAPPAGGVRYGNGLVRANDALAVNFRDDLPMTPPDEVSFLGCDWSAPWHPRIHWRGRDGECSRLRHCSSSSVAETAMDHRGTRTLMRLISTGRPSRGWLTRCVRCPLLRRR